MRGDRICCLRFGKEKNMKLFGNIRIGYKLVFGFSVMVLIMIVVGFTGFLGIVKIEQNLDDIFVVRLPSVDFLIEADRDLQQLLVAERSMIFADVKSEIFKKLRGDYEENFRQSRQRWEKYKALAVSAEEKAIFPEYEKARKEWEAVSGRLVKALTAGTVEGRKEALDLTLGLASQKFEEMRDSLDKLTEINLKIAQVAHQSASAAYRKALITLLIVSSAGLLSAVLLMWGIGRGVTKPLKGIIKRLTEASNQVLWGSGQVSASSQQLAEGSSEQAASVEETSASLEEISSMIRQNANSATHADGLVKEANLAVSDANDSMANLTESMNEISHASEETFKIIKTIDEIAFQTNLLALNAAVEAARAGEAGAGFAVVADEVRTLSKRAAEAAGNTSGLIQGTVQKVNEGGNLVTATNQAFSRVAESASRVGELIAEIAAASGEQTEGIEQINRAVGEMEHVIQQNSANAEESAGSAQEMSAQAEQMQEMVGELVALVRGRDLPGELDMAPLSPDPPRVQRAGKPSVHV